jgi:hypothetical protein
MTKGKGYSKGGNMTEDQILGVIKFTRRLKDTLQNSSFNKDPITEPVINYVLQVIDIHREYAEIERETEINKESEYFGRRK